MDIYSNFEKRKWRKVLRRYRNNKPISLTRIHMKESDIINAKYNIAFPRDS